MIIDFKEIPAGNKGGREQDTFEQFACDFLDTIGYKILRRPDRGPDGKKDLIVSETRKGIGGETIVKWIVSCKHYAHGGSAVKDTDELDIDDRVKKHQCEGFLGFYSTIPASSLSDKFHLLSNKIENNIYDSARIEKELLSNNQKDRLLISYFPKSFDAYHKQLLDDKVQEKRTEIQISSLLLEDDLFRITKTAIIILEIEKIKEEYYNNDWSTRDTALGKLYRYIDHDNEKVARSIFQFLQAVADQTRARMPSEIASSLHSLVLTFFPSSYDTNPQERIENGKQCIHIGFSLVYDALIYLNNYRIASYGLLIFKFIYREGKRNEMPELVEEVLRQYTELEKTINRPTRTDLENTGKLLKAFKDDLETWNLAIPDMSDELFELIEKGDEK